MTDAPDENRLLAAMDRTWTPLGIQRFGPWTLRRDNGGGKRVTAASTDSPVNAANIAEAEAEMLAIGQNPLFRLSAENPALDADLTALGYRIVDPVLIYSIAAADLVWINPEPLDAIPCDEPLERMQEIWAAGGFPEPRIEVMRRTPGPKTYLFCRFRDKPAGAAFVAIDGEIAMLHALTVIPGLRRHGIGRRTLARAAIWALENQAKHLTLVTTADNQPAQKLFAGLGMQIAGRYHYRMK
ncbi:MAG: GNAT family N-acetyltransferase [Rhodobacteraceae bacterium]|nr:GNAT family N-acetyltransferase [Paracoccaceae bacterium]